MAPTTDLIPFPGGSPLLPLAPPEAPGVEPPPSPRAVSLSLYQIEENLLALADTLDIVPPEQEQELVDRIGQALTQAVEKRDRMGQFLNHVEAQIAFADAEIKRLQERKRAFEHVLDKSEEYVSRVLQSLGQDAKGKWKKLEGHTVTFGLRKSPVSVLIDDENAIPVDFRSTTVKLPARLWESVLDALDIETAGQLQDQAKRSDEPSKSAVKKALEAQVEVPGAHLVTDKVRLVRA